MGPLMLYWAACVLLCVVVVIGTVVRQRWLRRREQQIVTADAVAMGEGDAALGLDARGTARFVRAGTMPTTGVGAALPERRRGGDRRRNPTDRRAQA